MRIDIRAQPPDTFGEVFWRRAIPSVLHAKNAVLDEIVSVIANRYLCTPDDESHVRLCLDEALVNAIRHGNREDPAKPVHVEVFGDDTGWGVIVRDQGQGFPAGDVADPTAGENLFREGGRGLLLMRELMDQVCFFAGGAGLFLSRRCSPRPPAPPE
ncbi:MAG: ATP-binding protein [Planctomycetes bacterium]|nr:ATP-binding protein [Planctomycetota bacterium]